MDDTVGHPFGICKFSNCFQHNLPPVVLQTADGMRRDKADQIVALGIDTSHTLLFIMVGQSQGNRGDADHKYQRYNEKF